MFACFIHVCEVTMLDVQSKRADSQTSTYSDLLEIPESDLYYAVMINGDNG